MIASGSESNMLIRVKAVGLYLKLTHSDSQTYDTPFLIYATPMRKNMNVLMPKLLVKIITVYAKQLSNMPNMTDLFLPILSGKAYARPPSA